MKGIHLKVTTADVVEPRTNRVSTADCYGTMVKCKIVQADLMSRMDW